MKCLFFLFASFVAVYAIIGGDTSPLRTAPFVATVRSAGAHICGGTVISSTRILTSAQCAEAITPSSASVRTGLVTLNNPEPGYGDYTISQIITHPDYDPLDESNNLAILVTAQPIAFNDQVAPLAFETTTEVLEHQTVTMYGWGETSEGGANSQHLRTVSFPVVPLEDCRLAYGREDVKAKDICAGVEGGGKGYCRGDFGGPLVHDTTGLLVGVASWEIGCGRPGFPGIYTRVGAYAEWIQENL